MIRERSSRRCSMIGIESAVRVLDSIIVQTRHSLLRHSFSPLVVTEKNPVWGKQFALVEMVVMVRDLLHQNQF